MCYDIQTGHLRRIKDGIRGGYPKDEVNSLIDQYTERYDPLFPVPKVHHHVSAFTHPEVTVLHYQDGKLVLEPMKWGLVPLWCKDQASATKLWNQTPNARSETIFEKPSFRAAARKRRGVILVESFFEHHHFKSKTYPFNIRRKDDLPMMMAVLWEEWTDKSTGEVWKTFSIVTTEGNELMSAIHNNPKLTEPRMPVILEGDAINVWLETPESSDNHLALLPLCKPLPTDLLKAHSVGPLRGKLALGDVPEVVEEINYEELVNDEVLQSVLN